MASKWKSGGPRICAASRVSIPGLPANVTQTLSPELGENADWRVALGGVTTVVHTAARVHQMHDKAADPLAEFRAVNTLGTLALARQAAASGTQRFVFVSSIKVNGEETSPGAPFAADDPPSPRDPYGISKSEAEIALRELGRETGMEIVIVRPVLVYGNGVGGNFLTMLRWVARELPLPLGSVHNLRSIVARANLADLLATCVVHPAAANDIFLVSDDEDISTTELIRRLAAGMGKRARLIPVHPAALSAAARIAGKKDVAHRLLSSLQVDISKTRRILGWSPPVSSSMALAETAREFLRESGDSH
ncbi:MAG: NAD-dependent epimerase/dehydratase family protein [Gemmatimonadota bacterium]|nr:NAD-dependent epimerase/dehydratase family protein [Gemmatimonadota bacterium]